MALDLETAMFQQDSFCYKYKDVDNNIGSGPWRHGFALDEEIPIERVLNEDFMNFKEWDINSSTDNCPSDEILQGRTSPSLPQITTPCRRKRRRIKTVKNKADVENQRITHIAVERNRRRQMNDYLAILRSMMPPSYVQRGDQASIIGGAINFLKELEQLLQSLKSQKNQSNSNPGVEDTNLSSLFSEFFTFPQYSTCSAQYSRSGTTSSATLDRNHPEGHPVSAIADVEVTMVDNHANIKVLARRQPKQLLMMVMGLHTLRLNVLHLTLTTVDHLVMYSFSIRVEDSCQLTSVNEIAAAVYDLVGRIQEESALNC